MCLPLPVAWFVFVHQSGATVRSINAHEERINFIAFNPKRFMMLTCSADYHAKLWDVETLEVKKDYRCDRPLNSGAISPLKEHVRSRAYRDCCSPWLLVSVAVLRSARGCCINGADACAASRPMYRSSWVVVRRQTRLQ